MFDLITALLVSLLIIVLVPLLVMNEMYCQAQLPYTFSDELHVTLCPASLKTQTNTNYCYMSTSVDATMQNQLKFREI